MQCTVELHLSGSWLSGSPIIRIGLALGLNLSRILQKPTCREMTGYRIKYCTLLWLLEVKIRRGRKLQMQEHVVKVTAELQTENVAYFQRKLELSGFSAYPDGSPSQLIRISGVLLFQCDLAKFVLTQTIKFHKEFPSVQALSEPGKVYSERKFISSMLGGICTEI